MILRLACHDFAFTLHSHDSDGLLTCQSYHRVVIIPIQLSTTTSKDGNEEVLHDGGGIKLYVLVYVRWPDSKSRVTGQQSRQAVAKVDRECSLEKF